MEIRDCAVFHRDFGVEFSIGDRCSTWNLSYARNAVGFADWQRCHRLASLGNAVCAASWHWERF